MSGKIFRARLGEICMCEKVRKGRRWVLRAVKGEKVRREEEG